MALVVRRTQFPSFRRFFRVPEGLAARPDTEVQRSWRPEITVSNADGRLTFSAEVEGVGPQELDVTVEAGIITISGERRQEQNVERRGRSWHTVSSSRFSHSYPLPEGADWENTEAVLTDGVLQVSVSCPQSEPALIPITAHEQEPAPDQEQEPAPS